MTQEDILRMARECFADPDGSLALLTPELTEFATLVAAAEREACAKLIEDWDSDMADPRDVAAAIRARNNP